MASTLSKVISDYRTTQQDIQNEQPTKKLTSLLNIAGQLYSIKDPAVEELASAVETRLSTLESKTWTAVTKGANDPKFATAVTQGTDGSISVTYSNLRDTALTDTATTGQFVTSVSQDVNGVVTTTKGGVDAANVTFNEDGWNAANAKAAILEALSKAIGTQSDLSSANTINAAKKYADEAVAALAGQDWEANAKKVSEIIAELENSENGNSWLTAIDKLAGMSIQKTGATAAEVVEYNEHLTGAIKAGDTLTAEQATAVNAAVSGASYSEGQEISAADSASYNATLQGAITAGENTQWTDTNVTVKEYVDNAVANASDGAAQAIAALDATVGSTSVATGKHVAVQVVETDGKLTGLTVTEDDIASAQALTTLTNTVEEHAQVTAAALTDLDSRINNLDFDVVKTEVKQAQGSIVTVAKTQDATDNHDVYTINLPVSYNASTETLAIG